MMVPGRFQLGVATHTGLVRSNNEDDYLLVAPAGRLPFELLAAVADGMGGVTGGAEASRTGLRGLAGGLLAAGDVAPGERMAAGFRSACARVHQQSRLVPALRDMGTTLTACMIAGTSLQLGHVGDSRAYRWRQGQLTPLTTDHAVHEQQNRLLRCIGGGQSEETPDLAAHELQPGDRLLLCTDGVWSVVNPARIAETLGRLPAQAAAERLLQLAIAAGGPDNGTAVVVHVADAAVAAPVQDVVLPVVEPSRLVDLARSATRWRTPWWPWPVAAAALLVLAASALRGLAGVDVLAFWRRLFE